MELNFLVQQVKKRRQEISDTVSRLGLKGSQADLNQIMTRIGDLDKITDKSLTKKIILNLATGGTFLEKLPILKDLSKVAQKAYMAS